MKKYIILAVMILIIVFFKWYLAPTTLNEFVPAEIDLSKVEKMDADIFISVFLPAKKIEIINKDEIDKLVDKISSLRVHRVIGPIQSLTFKPGKNGSCYFSLYIEKNYINIDIMDKDYIIIRNYNHNYIYKMVGENNLEEIYNLITKKHVNR